MEPGSGEPEIMLKLAEIRDIVTSIKAELSGVVRGLAALAERQARLEQRLLQDGGAPGPTARGSAGVSSPPWPSCCLDIDSPSLLASRQLHQLPTPAASRPLLPNPQTSPLCNHRAAGPARALQCALLVLQSALFPGALCKCPLQRIQLGALC
ncbi:unnamed protein product [Lampetra planeri]